MLGECHYRLGQYAEAIEYHEQVIKLYMANANWEGRVKFPPLIQEARTAASQARITWGSTRRTARIAGVPNAFSVGFGRLDNARVAEQGGVIQLPEYRQVNLGEIMRCVAVSMHRRHIIKGATCRYDPFTLQVISSLSGAATGDGSVTGAWKGVILGIALASSGNLDKASATLKSSLQISGGMDHPLTPLGLLALGHIEFTRQNYDEAKLVFLEASYSAAIFRQYDVIEEALEWATRSHLIQKTGTVFEPLPNAIKWLGRERVDVSEAALTVQLALCFAEIGEWRRAITTVGAALRGKSRTDAGRTAIAARAHYVAALAYFQKPDYKRANVEFASSMEQLSRGSVKLYQINLADSLVVNGRVTPREAALLYGVLLQDPSATDWLVDPMEALAFLMSNHLGPMERWFEVLNAGRRVDAAIEVADHIRRHRFYSALPLGGRLLALRWVMEGDPDALGDEAKKQRQDFLTRYPGYRNLSQEAERLRTDLQAIPPHPR